MAFAIYGRLTFGICDSGTADIWHLGIGAESNPAWHLAFAFSKALAFDIYDFATAGIWHLPAAILEIIGGVARFSTFVNLATSFTSSLTIAKSGCKRGYYSLFASQVKLK